MLEPFSRKLRVGSLILRQIQGGVSITEDRVHDFTKPAEIPFAYEGSQIGKRIHRSPYFPDITLFLEWGVLYFQERKKLTLII